MAVVAPQPKKPFSAPKPTRKFFVSDDDEEEEEEEDDDDAALRVTAMAATGNNNNTMDEDGCWSTVRTYDQECCTPTFANHRYDSSCLTPNASETDFIKKTPTLIAKQQQQPRPSLLSAMLTRQPPAAPQPQQKPSSASIMNRNSHHRRQRQRRLTACGASQEPAELSQSLKYCVDWEQRQNAVSRDMDPTLLLDLYHQRGSRPRPTYDNHCWESFRGW
ncbi:hypothetical protein BDB00DRAFT_856824 [Zychaea mexicana]|uniref:uncharacterized protein n=1 Tax=Zychaea mexicana TaxID=64656 RepID=UPI0022FECB2F|nr:uncharacterized protein BDB00DRAFT_856824 [Zychaea mexicana]KAI9482614.1 hypothetical protein BDB00DRAFT_856824 [Zychaea mexicana]